MKKARGKKYGWKSPIRTALDVSTLTTPRNKSGSSQKPGTSAKGDGYVSSPVQNSASDSEGPGIVPYDQRHPPSPKVPKGGKVKRSIISQDSIIVKHGDPDNSSDIDIQLSGKVASHAAVSTESSDTENDGKCFIANMPVTIIL